MIGGFVMSRNTAAVLTAILTIGIVFCGPLAGQVRSPWAVAVAAFLSASAIYRLLKGPGF